MSAPYGAREYQYCFRQYKPLVLVGIPPGPQQVFVGQASADDADDRETEPIRVGHVPTMIEPEDLFVEIPEQVKRFNAHVGALQRTLQQAPVILQPVRVDLPIDVGFGVVDDAVNVAALSHPVVGAE